MGIRDTLTGIKYMRHASVLEKEYQFVLENTNLSCSYCGAEFGTAKNVYVLDFLRHLAGKHTDKIDLKNIQEKIRRMENLF